MYFLLALITLFREVNPRTIRQTPDAASRFPQESLRLSCSVAGTSTPYMYWYRQYPGKQPQLIYYSQTMGHEIPEGKVDNLKAERRSDSEFNLKFSSLQADDTAVYYCAWSLHSDLAVYLLTALGMYHLSNNTDCMQYKGTHHFSFNMQHQIKLAMKIYYMILAVIGVPDASPWGQSTSTVSDLLAWSQQELAPLTVIPRTSVRAVLQRILPLALTPDWGVSLEISNAPTPKASEQERTVLDGWPIAGSGRQRLRVCVCASNTVNAEQYFGEGTRLTVLEAGQEIKNPKVTIFDPSEEEIRQRKKATIVCLANDFFPDYLKFSWTANGEEVEEKYVVTDRPQKGTDGLYSASSRATVPLEEWGRKEFSCKVIHYSKDGAEVHAEKKISSKTGLCEGNAERVRKQQIMAKTTYSLLISKSILYMATVIILLLKVKCSGKLAKHFD
ncbi:uncharacterized protein [Scyliorhinus torazame]|uniref:uncharacterized protein n=1 Tax=Scyliorhinus torazame TaxID=75743 RepID=UPI003B5B1166